MPILSFGPYFIAQDEGYFAEQGLEIEFVEFRRSAEGIPALVQGDLDVLAGSVSLSFLNGIAREANLRIVADKGHYDRSDCSSMALVARRALVDDAELDKIAQLHSRRFSINEANLEGYYVEKLLNEAGLTLADIEIVDIPRPAEREALENGSVDLISTTEPWLARLLESDQAVLWKPAEEVIPGFQQAVILFGPSLLENNRELGQRFMIAYLKGVERYNQGKNDRNLDILAKYTGLERELLEKSCWMAINRDGQINAESVLDFQAWGLEKGLLDHLVPTEQFWDGSFAAYANQSLATSKP